MDPLAIIESVLTTVIITGGGFGWREYRKHKRSHQKMERVNMHQIKAMLLDKHEKHTTAGYISRYHKEVVHDLYEDYKELGGNSFVGTLINDINELPIKEGGLTL